MKLIKKAYLVCLPYRQRPPLIIFFYDIVSLVYITIYLFFDIFGPFAKNSFRQIKYLYSTFINTYVFHRQNRPIGRLSRWPEDKVALEVYEEVILGCGLTSPILTQDELEEKIESTWREAEDFRKSIFKSVIIK